MNLGSLGYQADVLTTIPQCFIMNCIHANCIFKAHRAFVTQKWRSFEAILEAVEAPEAPEATNKERKAQKEISVSQLGFEPGTSCMAILHPNHYTSGS